MLELSNMICSKSRDKRAALSHSSLFAYMKLRNGKNTADAFRKKVQLEQR